MADPPKPPEKRETLFEPRFLHPGILILPVLILPSAILISALFTRFQLNGPAPLVMVAMVVSIICAVIGYWIYKVHRVRKLIRAHGRFLCLNCHYALTGLPNQGRCPECNFPYDRATTERRWRNWEEGVNKGKPLA